MPPPPPSTLPLGQRLMALAETLQFAWFAGHVLLLISAFFYGLTYITFKTNTTWAGFNYRTAFVAAAATYGIVVYKSVRARARSDKGGQNYIALLADENVQYLGMALLWLVSFQIPLAILPFVVYSVFHVATYTRSNLLPTLQPPQQQGKQASGLADTIGRFVKDWYDASMTLVAVLEIGLWFRILLSALLFSKGSWILLLVYTAFFRVRHSQSSFMQGAVSQLVGRVDGLAGNPNVPPPVRQGWDTVKGLVRQAADASDISKMLRQPGTAGPGGAPKKAQ